jgi:ATP-dependent Lhr-like helicase
MECIEQNGASFFHDLLENSGLLKSQLKEAIAELVALGRITSDSFGGLRALLVRSNGRRTHRWRHRSTELFQMEDAGRWSLVRRKTGSIKVDAIEHVARTLLRRYGVIFRRLIERETAGLPPWRDLLRAYRRLESRGEIRGGRFIAGFSGEQFALPEAIAMLREVRRQSDAEDWAVVSGSDPLNLAGILTPGRKLASLAGNRLVYRGGVPVAVLAAGEVTFFLELDPASEWQARELLLGGILQAPSIAPEIGTGGGRKFAHTWR